MSYCDDCLHVNMCAHEGMNDEAMTFCDDKITSPIIVGKSMTKEEIKNLELGDYVLVRCKVESRLAQSGMVMVTTRDCEKGFDAYTDEIVPGTVIVDCCNCKYYEGVHGVPGHAPCRLRNESVMHDDWCIYSKKMEEKNDKV